MNSAQARGETASGLVRVEVSDTHQARPVRWGNGLTLVDALAARWGVEVRLGPGKTVWAECTPHP